MRLTAFLCREVYPAKLVLTGLCRWRYYLLTQWVLRHPGGTRDRHDQVSGRRSSCGQICTGTMCTSMANLLVLLVWAEKGTFM